MKRHIGKLSLNHESIRVLAADDLSKIGGGQMTHWTDTHHRNLCTVTERGGGCWVTSITTPQYC